MRIFIGIKLPEDVREKIEKFLKPFKKISSPVRWTRPANIHVTLKFIGEVTAEHYARIENALTAAVYDTGPLDLTLRGCGKFGRGTGLDIFWIGIEPNEPLKQLYHTIENSLEPAGVEKEKRPFKPHLTVGRNKKNFNFKSFFTQIEENEHQTVAAFPASHFQLFKSRLTPEGPIYTILKEIPLVQS
jgi:2'-5' RNA ligase